MAAKRKYSDRYNTAVSIEKSEYDLTRTLHILLPDALRIGVNVMIQTMIANKDPQITKEVLGQFIEIQNRDMEDLRTYLRVQDVTQQRITEISELAKEGAKEKEIVEVWDPDQEEKVKMPRYIARRMGLVS